MKFSKKAVTDVSVILAGFAIGITMSGCAGLTGANGNVCNNNNQCVSFSEHPGSPSGSPASASTYPTPTPQSESPSASIPGATPSPTYSASATLTPPPSITAAPPTSSPVPEPQFDSSLHRCKSGGGSGHPAVGAGGQQPVQLHGAAAGPGEPADPAGCAGCLRCAHSSAV